MMKLNNQKEKLFFKMTCLKHQVYETIPRLLLGETYVLAILGVPYLLRGSYMVGMGSNIPFNNLESLPSGHEMVGPIYLNPDSYSEDWYILMERRD